MSGEPGPTRPMRRTGDRTSAPAAPLLTLVLAMALAASGCGDRPERADAPRDTPVVDTAPPDTVAPDLPGDGSEQRPFARPVAVYLEATTAEIETRRADVPDEDFYAMTDDLMFYRASAQEYLAAEGIEVVRLEGRRPVWFDVDGEARRYDFADRPTLDVVVLYEPGREPRALAPIDVRQAGAYFGR